MCESGYAVGYHGGSKEEIEEEHWKNRLFLAENGTQQLLELDDD